MLCHVVLFSVVTSTSTRWELVCGLVTRESVVVKLRPGHVAQSSSATCLPLCLMGMGRKHAVCTCWVVYILTSVVSCLPYAELEMGNCSTIKLYNLQYHDLYTVQILGLRRSKITLEASIEVFIFCLSSQYRSLKKKKICVEFTALLSNWKCLEYPCCKITINQYH